MRLFAAIDIELQVQKRIEQVQRQLKNDLGPSDRSVKWVRPKQIHLTLKFLGEVPDKMLTQVCNVVMRTAADCPGFDLEVHGLGAFGRPARVVWAGCDVPPELAKLQLQLDAEFEALGWDKENRPFAGHLTISRIKSASAGRKLEQAIETYANENFGTASVDQVVLYQSQLSSAGPEYNAVCTAPLK
jgi:2'-5' RNA ligase